jgi:hypothetical protein
MPWRGWTDYEDGEEPDPGDLVMKLDEDGVPMIYTQPERPWKVAGLIKLDGEGQLRFPDNAKSTKPGIYRVTISCEPKPARYVGSAGPRRGSQSRTCLRSRFSYYRSKGIKPMDPPGTSSLLAARYLRELRSGAEISIEIIDTPEMADFQKRHDLEKRFIQEIDANVYEVLNKTYRSDRRRRSR